MSESSCLSLLIVSLNFTQPEEAVSFVDPHEIQRSLFVQRPNPCILIFWMCLANMGESSVLVLASWVLLHFNLSECLLCIWPAVKNSRKTFAEYQTSKRTFGPDPDAWWTWDGSGPGSWCWETKHNSLGLCWWSFPCSTGVVIFLACNTNCRYHFVVACTKLICSFQVEQHCQNVIWRFLAAEKNYFNWKWQREAFCCGINVINVQQINCCLAKRTPNRKQVF